MAKTRQSDRRGSGMSAAIHPAVVLRFGHRIVSSDPTSNDVAEDAGVRSRPIVLVLGQGLSAVPTPIRQAAYAVCVGDGLVVRVEARSYERFLSGSTGAPPPLIGGVVLLDPPAHVVDRIRRWAVPFLTTPAFGGELRMVACDWMRAWSAEITGGPEQRAYETALSRPFRTYTLRAWEPLTPAQQSECCAKVRLDRSAVQEALLDEHLFNHLPAGTRLALAAELGVWDPHRLILVAPTVALDAFLPEELRALDEASTIEGWGEADRARALERGLRVKLRSHEADHARRQRHEVIAYRATNLMFATPDRWIALMERADEALA